jgi:hypothetical protein
LKHYSLQFTKIREIIQIHGSKRVVVNESAKLVERKYFVLQKYELTHRKNINGNTKMKFPPMSP